MKNKIVKSIIYRIFAFFLGQVVAWIVFKRFEFNLLVATVDGIQTLGYYIFEKLWERQE